MAWLRGLVRAVGDEALYDTIRALVVGFVSKAAPPLGEKTAEYIIFRIFGPKEEDERRFNRAVTLMDSADYARLSKKLAGDGTAANPGLTPDQQNYYRLTILCDKVKEMAEIMTAHARMSDAAWRRHVAIMDYNRDEAEARYHQFLRWVQPKLNSLGTNLAQIADNRVAQLNAAAAQVENHSQAWNANNFGIEEWSVRGSARNWFRRLFRR